MPEQPKQFDFSKIEDQKKFDELPKEEKGEIVDESQEEANKTNTVIDNEEYYTLERYTIPNILRYYNWRDGFEEKIDKLFEIKKKLKDDIWERIASSTSIKEKVKEAMSGCIFYNGITNAIKLKELFNISEEFLLNGNSNYIKLNSSERQSYLEWWQATISDEMIDLIKYWGYKDTYHEAKSQIDKLIQIKKSFDISKQVILFPEVQKKAKERITNLTSSGDMGGLNFALEIQKSFNISEDFIKSSAIQKNAFSVIANNIQQINECLEIEKKFHISKEFLSLPENQQIIKNALNYELIKFIPLIANLNNSQIINIAREMIFERISEDQDLADYFVENLDKYYQQPWVAEGVAKAIHQYSVAQKFVYAVKNDQTIWKNELWVADIFSKANVIVEEQKQFQQDDDWQGDGYGYSHGSEGFSEADPYENHPWRFSGSQIVFANNLARIMRGERINKIVAGKKLERVKKNYNIKISKASNKQNIEWQQDVDDDENIGTLRTMAREIEITPEMRKSIEQINKKIESAYNNFLEQIRSNPNIKDEDKDALINPDTNLIKMTPLLENIRSFVARYFVQNIGGDVTQLSEIENLDDLDRILAEGFRRYIKIHEIDVPLYDKLYEEFDNLRETGRYPLEVYLGRDGIYAWVGRRAQDVARRRKMGPEGRKKLKEMGEVIEINPQYTIYPRYFRDNINYETKRQFLEQEGISPDADPLFYDTGYTGTIPEQIMKVMDFDDEEIERRIRLLSAPSVHRRVKGISENARSEIIEYIEHNAKTEEVAEGLIIDEKTGKIRHIAKPTNPEEQFYFMMVKQAIARHYWLQEQLHHEPSGNVNLDSEHYTIRIRQEYAKLLPSEFMKNPKEFLTQQGELLKGSRGEGEYPDEEVVLFKMTNGTEIVAKKIELRKAKEARKEFSILISAKKTGLPTAEPIGFLSGKEENDGSYLLMKKINGISGRNFDKYLRNSGKFTEDKIKSILQQVAEKNKEMAELFRTTLKIDKRWRIKDTIIELNEETGEVENVIPIDWERAKNYNPSTPKEIDEIT